MPWLIVAWLTLSPEMCNISNPQFGLFNAAAKEAYPSHDIPRTPVKQHLRVTIPISLLSLLSLFLSLLLCLMQPRGPASFRCLYSFSLYLSMPHAVSWAENNAPAHPLQLS